MDLSDDDDDVIQTILLQKTLISESQSYITLTPVVPSPSLPSSSKLEEHTTEINSPKQPTPVDDGGNSYNDALVANMEYDNMLADLENNLKGLIADCKVKLEDLSKIREKGTANGKMVKSFSGRNNCMYIFGAPYFKDKGYYPCPPNADTLTKKKNGEINWVNLPSIHWWTPQHTKKLVAAVKESSLAACKQDAISYKNSLLRKQKALLESGQEEEAKVLGEEIEAFDAESYAKSKLSEKIAESDHDWMQISATVLDGKHSPSECHGFWYNYLHPKFYKGAWTADESEKLRKLAMQHDCQNWDLIAEKLDTNRSGYQCFAQFQSEICGSTRQKWSDKEDALLKNLVTKYRCGDYIPWGQVSLYMDGRTQTQVYNRWSYTLDPAIKKGRFSLKEDIIIMCGVRRWGEDFGRIAQFMPDRTAPQIRTRYHGNIAKQDSTPFTYNDDVLLLDLVKTYGKDWKKISEHFPNKNRIKVRHRHETIQKWIQQNPGKELGEISSRRCLRPNLFKENERLWTYAEKLLSGARTRKKETPLLTVKATKKSTKKGKKKPPLAAVDDRLYEYFRDCHSSKPRRRLDNNKRRYDAKCVKQMASFLELLGAKLHIPSDEVLDADKAFSADDATSVQPAVCPPHSFDMLRVINNHARHVRQNSIFMLKALRKLQCDAVTPSSAIPGPSDEEFSIVDIDCTPQSASTVSVSLPFTTLGISSQLLPVPVVKQEPISGIPCTSLYGNLRYLCPPNPATMVGLRSILLRKRTLVENVTQSVCDPLLIQQDHLDSEHFKLARQKWDDRLLCLFGLPNVLTKKEPAPVSIHRTLHREVVDFSLPVSLAPKAIRTYSRPKKPMCLNVYDSGPSGQNVSQSSPGGSMEAASTVQSLNPSRLTAVLEPARTYKSRKNIAGNLNWNARHSEELPSEVDGENKEASETAKRKNPCFSSDVAVVAKKSRK